MVKKFIYWADAQVGDIVIDSADPHEVVGIITRITRALHVSRSYDTTMLVSCLRSEGFVDTTHEIGLTWVLRRAE